MILPLLLKCTQWGRGFCFLKIRNFSYQLRNPPIPDAGADGKLVVKNRAERNRLSSGYKLQFKQLEVVSVTYDEQTIDYEYDAISRLLSAVYAGTAKRFDYTFDLAGNRTSEAIDGGAPTTFTYNAANQITNAGFTYDNNGNMTSDGVNSYGWDRANRMMSHNWGISHLSRVFSYDGLGRRVQSSLNFAPPPPGQPSYTITDYLLDTQPALAQVIAATTSGNTEHYVHGPRGIHAMESSAGAWTHATQDGLGSVRVEIGDALDVIAKSDYQPFGVDEDVVGTFGLPFRFTGEETGEGDLIYLRNRYYNPGIGVFPSLDPFEGVMDRPMSLNGYSWVEGDPINAVDPDGLSQVHIWASAFIMPQEIRFVHWDDGEARWKGDGRGFYSGGPVPDGDARVYFNIEFDWTDLSNNVTNKAGTNFTQVTWRAWQLNGALLTERGKAPDPSDPTINCGDPSDAHGYSHVYVEFEADGDSGKNPLFPLAPPIEMHYKIWIAPRGVVYIARTIDRFPWHELFIEIDGVPVVELREEPPGPFRTPFDLFLPAYSDNFHMIFPASSDEECIETPSLCQELQLDNCNCNDLP